MDRLAALAPLRNRYLCVRHGESEANVAGLVSSDPGVSTLEHGLTPTGLAQAREAASAVRLFADGAPIACVASDFLRTRHTAETMAVAPVTFDVRLRERYFGEFNGKSHEAYKIVWAHDAEDGGLQHTCDNVER
jgi:probable phosphoglycerate mutase